MHFGSYTLHRGITGDAPEEDREELESPRAGVQRMRVRLPDSIRYTE